MCGRAPSPVQAATVFVAAAHLLEPSFLSVMPREHSDDGRHLYESLGFEPSNEMRLNLR